MPKLMPADAGRGSLQSERERFATGHAWTVGRDETLSARQIITWSMLESGSYAAWTPESWLADALRDLRDVFALPPGWDSYGAPAIDPDAAAVAREVLRLLAEENAPRPRVVPTSDGGIHLDWHGAGVEFQLEIEPQPERVTLFFSDLGTGAYWEGPLGEEPEPFSKLLWRISTHG